MSGSPVILLPKVLPILRPRRNQSIAIDTEEYSIYFRNVVYPFEADYDIVVDCRYGGNYGEFWRIKNYPDDTDAFDLTLSVYAPFGKLLARKTCRIELYDKLAHAAQTSILCIGDSMTHREVYMRHVWGKLNGLRFIGTRCFNGWLAHEGRGGWTAPMYLERTEDEWGGTSPFLFPKGISGEEFYGNMDFMTRVHDPDLDSYCLDGYAAEEIREGQVFYRSGELWRRKNGTDVPENRRPEWEFRFDKYLRRHNLGRADIVTFLLGANDMQCRYEDMEAAAVRYDNALSVMARSVRDADPDTKIVFCLPVPCAEQYAWGLRGNGSAGSYRLGVVHLCEQILEKYDGREAEGLYVCHMPSNLDPIHGFPMEYGVDSRYGETSTLHQSNWVHPNAAGYAQMGDSLAAVIEKIRCAH